MNKFKLWIARKLLKGDIYIGEGAKIYYGEHFRVECKNMHVDGSIESEEIKSVKFSGVKPIPKNEGECDYHWVRTEIGKEKPLHNEITEDQLTDVLVKSSTYYDIKICDSEPKSISGKFLVNTLLNSVNELIKPQPSNSGFSITKEQYDKDIAQAKKDAVTAHCKEVAESIKTAMNKQAYWNLFKS